MIARPQNKNISRRSLLRSALVIAVGIGMGAFQPETEASVGALQGINGKRDWRAVVLDRDRWLHLERASTGEKGVFRYYVRGRGWESKGYATACYLLRDVTSNVTIKMDKRLIDLLFIIQSWLRLNKLPYVITIISGHRTEKYNATVPGAAKDSEHVKGTAADIKIKGVSTDDLQRLARAIGVGGVGVYTRQGFVHVDVGRIRKWVG